MMILPVETVPEQDEIGEYYLINPSKSQFKEIIHQDTFTESYEFKRI